MNISAGVSSDIKLLDSHLYLEYQFVAFIIVFEKKVRIIKRKQMNILAGTFSDKVLRLSFISWVSVCNIYNGFKKE